MVWSSFVLVARCERIAWGGFERGPVFVLWEYHGKFTAPLTCDDGERHGGRDVNILRSIWFDDPDLVEYAKTRWNMPARLGTFSVEFLEPVPGEVNQTTWTWREPGSEPSYFSIHRGPIDEAHGTWEENLFWFTPDHLYLLTRNDEFDVDSFQGPLTPGHMAPPMLYAETGVSEYMGIGTPYNHVDYLGNIQEYGDFECGPA